MVGPPARSTPVAFDRYVLQPDERRLLLDGKPVVLRGKAFELLAILVAHGGAAVSRDALYELLWPNGAVEDGNLTQNVYLLRRTLDPAGGGASGLYLPVSTPWASGDQTIWPMPSSAQHGKISSCGKGQSIEYCG